MKIWLFHQINPKNQEGRKIKKVFRLGFFVILLQTNNHFRIALVAERIIYYIP